MILAPSAALTSTPVSQRRLASCGSRRAISECLLHHGATHHTIDAVLSHICIFASACRTSSSMCHAAVVFLTDGVNEDGNTDPRPLINAHNEGPWHGLEMPETLPSGRPATRIFTYTFGDGDQKKAASGGPRVARSLMQDVACGNGGLYQAVSDDQAKHLKEVMANYFVYMAAGMVPPELAKGAPTARWVDIFEDGRRYLLLVLLLFLTRSFYSRVSFVMPSMIAHSWQLT